MQTEIDGINVQAKRPSGTYEQGYTAGYAYGVREGLRTFGTSLEITSIIIPTYDRIDLLLQCLDHIDRHTTSPYEVIVVDNGSSDGTAAAVRRRRGRVRLAVHPRNLGFARAINTGLMMAKGNTIVLLNNDVLVTERWLDQLLACLQQFPEAAAAGPVTNYISGEQQIGVPYDNVADMPAFAALHNRSDPQKWRVTDRLVGFCVAFPRTTLEQIGYFDEGYEIGNFEDDDWVARLRLQGKRMVIAGDTFVHHYGSMTMKGLGSQGFQEINTRNYHFFSEKWGNLHALYARVPAWRGDRVLRAADFFPTHVRVRDANGGVHWLEHGVRYPLHQAGEPGTPPEPTRLSVLDLLQLPPGPARSPEQVPWRSGGILPEAGGLAEGAVVFSGGRWVQIDRGQRREIISEYALRAWGLAPSGAIVPVPEDEVAAYSEGLPILPPPRMISDDL
ncbi:glycosyltransferase family 2 protein [uncultured Paenibacillus sp.]|uniref:glycosyltransferase family 2 protein n=1 Tax=uncultured Paenibacillus sp. TaxID=227322 RepID=UPI0015ACF2CB|nr:glycosyltransferase family 2 protein [uncultured Paenibacillus sp.]